MPAAQSIAPRLRNSERRRSPRRTVTLGGRLFYGLAGLSLDCIIRDLSDHGARVAVSSALWKAPKQVHLLTRQGMVYTGVVMWNRGRYLGLDFTNVRKAADLNDPALARVKAAWLEQAGKA
jgi:hypothetical protein